MQPLKGSQAGRVGEARDALNKAIAIGSGSFDMYVRARVPWHRVEDYRHPDAGALSFRRAAPVALST